MDYTVRGILQARLLEWVAMLSSRVSSQHRDWTEVSHIAGRFFTSWATREACDLEGRDRQTRRQETPARRLTCFVCFQRHPSVAAEAHDRKKQGSPRRRDRKTLYPVLKAPGWQDGQVHPRKWVGIHFFSQAKLSLVFYLFKNFFVRVELIYNVLLFSSVQQS